MLPTRDIPWPPQQVVKEIHRVNDLADRYAGRSRATYPVPGSGTQSNLVSRIIGSMTWTSAAGRTSTGWTESNPLHVPMAADLARTSADLLFAQCPAFTVDGPAPQARLEDLVDSLGLEAMLVESGELCAALSGVYWRVGFDLRVFGSTPCLDFVQPDNAWPEWARGRLVAVTFWRILPTPAGRPDEVIWRHLERHSVEILASGRHALVEHGLYVGTKDNLGARHPLENHPDTADLVPSLNNLALSAIDYGDGPITAGYIPNMLPNRLDRGSRLGRPDIEQLEGLLDGVNETWTSWMRDLRLAKGRIIVPDEWLRSGDPGQGATFDMDREIFAPLRMMAPDGNIATGMQIIQFAIRTADHQATLRALTQQIVTAAGYSLRTFGIGDTDLAGATATQVNAEDRLSAITREKKSRYWEDGLEAATAALMHVDRVVFGGPDFDPSTIDVEVDADPAPDPQASATVVNLWSQAGAASVATMVGAIHPEWTQDEVKAEVDAIQKQNGTPVADPTTLLSGIQQIGGAMMSGTPNGMNGQQMPAGADPMMS